jgi:ABC-type lipoprotein export system ATPase subunit
MKDNLYYFKDLQFGYSKNEIVLSIPELTIPRNKLVFVIGKSGIGKSTFIESIGLMNNTLRDQGHSIFDYFLPDQSVANLNNIWNTKQYFISNFRAKNYSFIFQENNLMSHFTAGENMAIGLLMNGVKKSKAKTIVVEYMEKVGLDPLIYERPISALSGGQRQRLSFVRGLCQEFEVLFGDEPTGNLDKITANTIMNLLKDKLQSEGKSGIIVSHDIDLALEYGDIILPILKDKNGILAESNKYIKTIQGWQFKNENLMNPVKHLTQLLSQV